MRNAAKCLRCLDVIESKHVHDFRRCSCGDVFVDGGLEYLRRGWSTENNGGFEDLSEHAEEPSR